MTDNSVTEPVEVTTKEVFDTKVESYAVRITAELNHLLEAERSHGCEPFKQAVERTQNHLRAFVSDMYEFYRRYDSGTTEGD